MSQSIFSLFLSLIGASKNTQQAQTVRCLQKQFWNNKLPTTALYSELAILEEFCQILQKIMLVWNNKFEVLAVRRSICSFSKLNFLDKLWILPDFVTFVKWQSMTGGLQTGGETFQFEEIKRSSPLYLCGPATAPVHSDRKYRERERSVHLILIKEIWKGGTSYKELDFSLHWVRCD